MFYFGKCPNSLRYIRILVTLGSHKMSWPCFDMSPLKANRKVSKWVETEVSEKLFCGKKDKNGPAKRQKTSPQLLRKWKLNLADNTSSLTENADLSRRQFHATSRRSGQWADETLRTAPDATVLLQRKQHSLLWWVVVIIHFIFVVNLHFWGMCKNYQSDRRVPGRREDITHVVGTMIRGTADKITGRPWIYIIIVFKNSPDIFHPLFFAFIHRSVWRLSNKKKRPLPKKRLGIPVLQHFFLFMVNWP